jgi:hypothetical protein
MKKMILGVAVLLLAGTTQAQELKKGNVVGTHIAAVKLEPGGTMEQFAAFYINRVLPQVEKTRGWKLYPVRRIRGEKADGFAVIMVIASEAERDKYYNADGTDSELGKAANAKVQPILDELKKLGTFTSDVYTDWLVY